MDTSYLSQQVTTIIERLHGFFDEIGVPRHERDSRESELFSALSETLHNQLNAVAKEKHDLTEQAQALIKTIKQMERSLDDSRSSSEFDAENLKVTFPLHSCIQSLKEKQHTISKLHRERYEQVKKLVEALESYASHLEPSFVQIKLPPTSPNAKISPSFDLSPTYVSKLDREFTRVYEEYNRRIAQVSQIAGDIVGLWSELGTPQPQVDSTIVQHAQDSPEQLGLHQEDLKRLVQRRDKLVSEKNQRERKLRDLRSAVDALWDRLGVEESERKSFLASNRGCGVRQINEFEDELSRLNELKRQNLHLFVEDAQFKLQELWDGLYFSEEEMLDFTPAFSHEYTDALLSAHENEIKRLEALKEQRAPILAYVDRHRSLIKEREELEASAKDASRLMGKGAKGEKRDPGKLLREEKMRKRIAKELPKVESELRNTLEGWEDEYGRPFCVHGQRYLDELDAASAKAPPPRSKTPNALSQSVRGEPKSAGRSRAGTAGPGTLRGAPPRSKTPTGPPKMASRPQTSHSTMAPTPDFSKSVIGSSVSAASSNSSMRASPSKIPGSSRLPMSTMRDGENSPQRTLRGTQSHGGLGHKKGSKSEDLRATVRGMPSMPSNMNGQSNMAPPPRMKDLFNPPTPTNENYMPEPERSASVIRHLEPEDPYDDSRSYRTMHSSSVMGPPPTRPGYGRAAMSQDCYGSFGSSSRPMSRQQGGGAHDYPRAPPSRNSSNTSSIMSGHGSIIAVSSNGGGSENWETYSSTSENEELDATEAYYARVRAQRLREREQYAQLKRPATATGQLGASKKVREQVIAEEAAADAYGAVDASDAGWTDDGDVGDTY
ncbi:hypothetical protein D0869_04795 [Hortaea werneckii]|uniref:Uncharacterized protein n=1 Tax=Hortaea werneckii TaxID=91943 RepID=A0A3M6ZJG1_HORWE|nr:hypothetical protein D0869_04795 [Hortaea werneckii]RMY15307.1 hypothetical protein D0868_00960 [Hortaea werneckii]